MPSVQSKLLCAAVECTCKDFHHPWTDKCINATAGMLLVATPYCFRVYTMVYAISLLMRARIPTLEDLNRTARGILQSSAFLVTNSFGFIMYNCLLRQIIGRYYLATVSFVPSILANLTAIIVERPARRPLLALYVANVATETLWNMAESRGWVRSIPQGQTLIFGVSVSILLYLYRLGLHKDKCKDSLFNILRIFVGKGEEGPLQPAAETPAVENQQRSRPPLDFTSISGLLQVYARFIDALKHKNAACPHSEANCISYAVLGGLKPFVGGVGIQVALKLIMNIRKVAQLKLDWRKTLLDRKTLKLGMFLGSFSFLYKSVSCVLRHSFGCDDARFAIPAGLIASVSFTQYPDVTVALYVMWKMLQIIYNFGIQNGVAPRIPGFTCILYALSTAVLFHAGILEPSNLRPSYFKFLQAISGERLTAFQLQHFDGFGLNSAQDRLELMNRLNIVPKLALPKMSLASF